MKNIKFEQNKVKVLLIGVSKYTEDKTINSIPNIKQNISLLKKAILENEILNVEETDIIVSLNENRTNIERRLIQISREARNSSYTLIVYYSGHGIISTQDFRLYLTATDTTNDYLESDGINISRFREIIESSRAGRKIVILDSCHSGAVHNTMNTISSQIQSELNKFEGTYVISSASKNEPSLYPADNAKLPTYFTAKFLEVLNNGIDNNKEFITIRDIFEEIEFYFRAVKGFPIPQQSVFLNADKMIFAKNKAYSEKKYINNFEINYQPVSLCNNNVNYDKPKNVSLYSLIYGKVASFLL